MRRSAPFAKRRTDGPGQLVRCPTRRPGAWDSEEHDAGEFIYLDERQAWQLQNRGALTIVRSEEETAVRSPRRRSASALVAPC
jgi:hypothetical protein